jgi:hypothetical protein
MVSSVKSVQRLCNMEQLRLREKPLLRVAMVEVREQFGSSETRETYAVVNRYQKTSEDRDWGL